MVSKTHILAIPLPLQGHMNPMLQLCKRLASRGVMVTLVTISSANISVDEHQFNSITIEYIAEECNEVEKIDAKNAMDALLKRFHSVVSKNLAKIMEEKASSGHPVKVVMYDSLMTWALEIVHNQGIKGAAFFTQACSVCAIYNHIHRGTLKVPLELETSNVISLPSMPLLEPNDLPSVVYDPCAYSNGLDFVLVQNINLEKADWLLFNSFDKLENEIVNWLGDRYAIKTIGPSSPSIGPSSPSMHTDNDKQLEDDKDYTARDSNVSIPNGTLPRTFCEYRKKHIQRCPIYEDWLVPNCFIRLRDKKSGWKMYGYS